MAVTCYQGDHAILAYAVGIPGLLLVALFLPMASAWYLVRNKWVQGKGEEEGGGDFRYGIRTPMYNLMVSVITFSAPPTTN